MATARKKKTTYMYRSPITGKDVKGKTYVDEWHSFIDPMEKKYSLVAISYDPDIRFGRECNRGSSIFYADTVTLPLWFVKQLLEDKNADAQGYF